MLLRKSTFPSSKPLKIAHRGAVTLKMYRDAMQSLWRKENAGKEIKSESKSESKSEIALSASENMSKVKCYKCGKLGHKAYQCKSKASDSVSSRSKDNKTSNATCVARRDTE